MRISDLIIHNDHHLVACCKPPGMPTQDDKTGDKSLQSLVSAFCKRNVYVVHRLDRPVSGVVVFAKTKQGAAHLSGQFAERNVIKEYVGIVTKGIDPVEGTLRHYLVRNRQGKATVGTAEAGGVESVLDYKVIRHLDNYDVLEIRPLTGRTHQIRAQLSAIGHPIKGDVRYGSRRGNKDRSITLHCRKLGLIHPSTGESLVLECGFPEDRIWGF